MISSMPANPHQPRRHREYQASLFAGRRSELDVIATNVREAQAGNVAEPLITFWGIEGIGKTWILRHLQHLYAYPAEQPTFTLLYTFSTEPATAALEHVVQALAGEAFSQLASALSTEEQERLALARDRGDIDALVAVLLALSRRFVPLILLDNAEQVRQADWELLELRLIEPLVSTGRVLVVIAGRRQVPRWRRFEVRRRVKELEHSRLRPFDRQAVEEQIEKGQYQVPADLLFPYTAGSPYLVDMLAQRITDLTKGLEGIKPDQAWFDQHQGDLLQILRDSERQLLNGVRENLRGVLYAVSPLRFYRVEALRSMFTGHSAELKEQADGYYLNILRSLDQETDVVWWDRARRAYVTSEVVRQLVNRRQLLENRSAYAAQHRQALDMYWGWVREYPGASEDFIVEIWFHLTSLSLADGEIDLRSEVHKALDVAHEHLSSDRFLILQQQFEGDSELCDFLSEDLYNELRQELERLPNDKAQ